MCSSGHTFKRPEEAGGSKEEDIEMIKEGTEMPFKERSKWATLFWKYKSCKRNYQSLGNPGGDGMAWKRLPCPIPPAPVSLNAHITDQIVPSHSVVFFHDFLMQIEKHFRKSHFQIHLKTK